MVTLTTFTALATLTMLNNLNTPQRDPEVVRKVMGLTDSIRGKSGPPAMFAEKGIYREDETEWFLYGADKLIDAGFKQVQDCTRQVWPIWSIWSI